MAVKQAPADSENMVVKALRLQDSPPVYVTVIPGRWLLDHTTPSWRMKEPIKGFQRIVNQQRAKQIARTVLDEGRTFPNAITLATDIRDFKATEDGDGIVLPKKVKFLVVDGQHRLWAQTFSEVDSEYACIVHLHKTEKEMAELFPRNQRQPAPRAFIPALGPRKARKAGRRRSCGHCLPNLYSNWPHAAKARSIMRSTSLGSRRMSVSSRVPLRPR